MNLIYTIGREYKYPTKSKRKYKLINVDRYMFRFECGHWCTDCVFEDLIDTVTGIQVYMNNQLKLFYD